MTAKNVRELKWNVCVRCFSSCLLRSFCSFAFLKKSKSWTLSIVAWIGTNLYVLSLLQHVNGQCTLKELDGGHERWRGCSVGRWGAFRGKVTLKCRLKDCSTYRWRYPDDYNFKPAQPLPAAKCMRSTDGCTHFPGGRRQIQAQGPFNYTCSMNSRPSDSMRPDQSRECNELLSLLFRHSPIAPYISLMAAINSTTAATGALWDDDICKLEIFDMGSF